MKAAKCIFLTDQPKYITRSVATKYDVGLSLLHSKSVNCIMLPSLFDTTFHVTTPESGTTMNVFLCVLRCYEHVFVHMRFIHHDFFVFGPIKKS